jgi:hypothetical protein
LWTHSTELKDSTWKSDNQSKHQSKSETKVRRLKLLHEDPEYHLQGRRGRGETKTGQKHEDALQRLSAHASLNVDGTSSYPPRFFFGGQDRRRFSRPETRSRPSQHR